MSKQNRDNPCAFAVVILGAGASTRMGRAKLLMPWGVTSVLGHLIQTWRGLGTAQVTVVHAAGDDPLKRELDRLDFPQHDRIANSQPELGMFSSIRCASRWDAWRPGLTDWVIALGDQPHLRRPTLEALLAFRREHPGTICQPAFGGHAGHPVLMPRRAFEALRDCQSTTLREFLEQTPVPRACCEVNDAGLSLDLDRPEDYRKAVEFFSAKV